MLRNLLVVLCTLALSTATAQRPNGRPDFSKMPANLSITGIVIDSANGSPMEFASVALYHARKDSLISGGITDSKGRFEITQLRPGPYKLVVQFIGYKEITLDRIMLKPGGTSPMDVGTISLPVTDGNLPDVVVVGEKSFMQSAVDRKIYNVDQLISSESSSAAEIMENIPSVQVDIDGNISLRGSGQVTILIDGKPSSLTGFDRQSILDQIPGASIERIEVITNPSAKFDPDGMAGIINIVLKKSKKPGFNGSASATVGTGQKYDGNVALNFRQNKLNMYVNYSYRNDRRESSSWNYRESFFNDSLPFLEQNSLGYRLSASNLIKAGFDYDINKYNNLSVSGNYSARDKGKYSEINYTESDSLLAVQNIYRRDTKNLGAKSSYDIGSMWIKKFSKPAQELQVSANYSTGGGDDNGYFIESYFTPTGVSIDTSELLQQSYQDRLQTLFTMQADYVHPIKENGKFEIGAKSIIRDISNNIDSYTYDYPTNEYLSDTGVANHFKYKEQIHSFYSQLAGQYKKFKLMGGLRLEQAKTNSELVLTGEKFEYDYFSLFPSGTITYEKDKKTSFQASYSRRIHRPSMRSINPFTNISDPANIRRGNPFLSPEYINSMEVGYNYQTKKQTIGFSLFYKDVNNNITRIRAVDTSGVGVTTYVNLAGATNQGIELIYVAYPNRKINFNSSFTLTQIKLDGSNLEGDLNNQGFNWFGRVMGTYKFNKQLSTQVTGMYHSKIIALQGTSTPFFWFDCSVKYSFADNKAHLSLRVSDIFNNRQWEFSSVGEGFSQSMISKRESRIGYLTFTYRFGKSEKSKRRRRGGGIDDGGGMDDFDI